MAGTRLPACLSVAALSCMPCLKAVVYSSCSRMLVL